MPDALEDEWQDIFGSGADEKKRNRDVLPPQRKGDPQMVETAEKAKDHANHQSCDPCTMVCPFCAKQMLLSGMIFHMAECKKVLSKRAEAASGRQDVILRTNYPYSIYLADKSNRSNFMSDKSFGALGPKKGDAWGPPPSAQRKSEGQHSPISSLQSADDSSDMQALPQATGDSATICISLEIKPSLLSVEDSEEARTEWLMHQLGEYIQGEVSTLQIHGPMVDAEIVVGAHFSSNGAFMEQAESKCRALGNFAWVKSVYFVSFPHGSPNRPRGSNSAASGPAVKAAKLSRKGKTRRIVDASVSRTRRERLAAQPFTSKAVLALADEDRARVRDHSQHYTCHPCTVKCRTCPLAVVVWGYPFHVQHCANKAEAIERLDPDSLAVSMSIEQAVRAQYPLSDYLLNQTSSLPGNPLSFHAPVFRESHTSTFVQRRWHLINEEGIGANSIR
jgi:hypothetical protein